MNISTTFKDCLLRHLYGGQATSCPPMEARIVSLYPLQVADSFNYSIEFGELEDEIISKLRNSMNRQYKILLDDWNFEIKPIDGQDGFYFDVVIRHYRYAYNFPPDISSVHALIGLGLLSMIRPTLGSPEDWLRTRISTVRLAVGYCREEIEYQTR